MNHKQPQKPDQCVNHLPGLKCKASARLDKLSKGSKRNYEVRVKLPEEFEHARLSTVDERSGDNEPRVSTNRWRPV